MLSFAFFICKFCHFLYGDSLTVVVAVVMWVIIRNNRWAGMKNKVFSSIWIAKKKISMRGFYFDSTHYFPIEDSLFTSHILYSTTIFLHICSSSSSVSFAFLLFGKCRYIKCICSPNHPMYYDSVPENKF